MNAHTKRDRTHNLFILLLAFVVFTAACETTASQENQVATSTNVAIPSATEPSTPTEVFAATSTPPPTATPLPTPTVAPLPPTPQVIANLSYEPGAMELHDPSGIPIFRLDKSGQWLAIPPTTLLAQLEELFGPLQSGIDRESYVLTDASNIVVAQLAGETGKWEATQSLVVVAKTIYQWQGTEFVAV